jgi:hypothetical protein
MNPKRPSIITVVCIYLVLGAFILVRGVLSGSIIDGAKWYPIYLVVAGIVQVVGAVGLWTMRRWGAIVVIVFSAVSQIVLVIIGEWTIFSLLIVAVLVGILYSQYSKMK